MRAVFSTSKLWEFLFRPSRQVSGPQEIQRAELISALALLGVLFGGLSFIGYSPNVQPPILVAARLMGVLGGMAGYFLGRTRYYANGAWILIYGSTLLPPYVEVFVLHHLDIVIYMQIGIVASFFLLEWRQALMSSGIILLMLGSLYMIQSPDAMRHISANIFLAAAIAAGLTTVVRRRDSYLHLIESQAQQLIEYERRRQEFLLQQQQTKFYRDVMTRISHDIKTPLSNINIRTFLLDRKCGEPEQKRLIDQINGSVTRVNQIVDDLELLKQTTSSTETTLGLTSVTAVLEQQKPLWMPKDNQKLDIKVNEHPLLIWADQGALGLALTKVVENAVHHTSSNAEIRVDVTHTPFDVVIRIADNGPGIPPHELNEVFNYFYKVDKARSTDVSRSGLGLPIARHIVVKHNGRINIESQLGQGTMVTIRIPRADPSQVDGTNVFMYTSPAQGAMSN